jgi:hypothetical protein
MGECNETADDVTSPRGEPTMTRSLRGRLLIASLVIVAWATTSEACHRRRTCPPAPCGSWGYTSAGYNYASPQGYAGVGGGYGMAGTGYYGGGYAGGMAGYPGGYGGYAGGNGSMAGGYLRGRALGAMGAPAWTYGLGGGGLGGGQLMGAAAGYRAAGGR